MIRESLIIREVHDRRIENYERIMHGRRIVDHRRTMRDKSLMGQELCITNKGYIAKESWIQMDHEPRLKVYIYLFE